MDSNFGSGYESDHEPERDNSLEEAQNTATFGKKRCGFNKLKSSEEGTEKEKEEGEYKDSSEIDAGIGAEKIPCPNKDVLLPIPMAPQLSLNADTGGTTTLPKSSLAIKEELMQTKGLFLKKAVDPTVPIKKDALIMPNLQQRKESQASPNLFLLATKEFFLKRSAMKLIGLAMGL